MSPRHLTDEEFLRYARSGESFDRDDYLERIELLMERLAELERSRSESLAVESCQGIFG